MMNERQNAVTRTSFVINSSNDDTTLPTSNKVILSPTKSNKASVSSKWYHRSNHKAGGPSLNKFLLEEHHKSIVSPKSIVRSARSLLNDCLKDLDNDQDEYEIPLKGGPTTPSSVSSEPLPFLHRFPSLNHDDEDDDDASSASEPRRPIDDDDEAAAKKLDLLLDSGFEAAMEYFHEASTTSTRRQRRRLLHQQQQQEEEEEEEEEVVVDQQVVEDADNFEDFQVPLNDVVVQVQVVDLNDQQQVDDFEDFQVPLNDDHHVDFKVPLNDVVPSAVTSSRRRSCRLNDDTDEIQRELLLDSGFSLEKELLDINQDDEDDSDIEEESIYDYFDEEGTEYSTDDDDEDDERLELLLDSGSSLGNLLLESRQI